MNVMNGVVEVVNSYEDGVISVKKCDLGSWKWLWCVLGGDESKRNGEVELVVFDGDYIWEELEVVLKEKFNEYKVVEVENGYDKSYENSEDGEDFDWDKVEEEMLNGVKELFGDGMEVCKVLVGGYSVECDNEFVVIVMKM